MSEHLLRASENTTQYYCCVEAVVKQPQFPTASKKLASTELRYHVESWQVINVVALDIERLGTMLS